MSVEISYEFSRYLSRLVFSEPLGILNKLGGYNAAGKLLFTSGQDYITQQWENVIKAFEKKYTVVNYSGNLPRIGKLIEPPKNFDVGREIIKGLSGHKPVVDKLALISVPHKLFPCTASIGVAFLGCAQGKVGAIDVNSVRYFVLDLPDDDGVNAVVEIRRDEEEVLIVNVQNNGTHSHEDVLRAVMLKTMNML